jgi:hypothetical protein
MKRVHEIEKAISARGTAGDTAPGFRYSETPGPAFGSSETKKGRARVGRVMYIESKAGSLTGEARIGRVTFSQTGCTVYYRGKRFQSLKGKGFKSNYYDVDTGEDYWISGPKRKGGDRLYADRTPVEIDEDVREEYWREIRRQPERVREKVA